MSTPRARGGVLSVLAMGALLVIGGCQTTLAPEEKDTSAGMGRLEAAGPLMNGAGGEQSTASAPDSTGRSGVYIGSGH